jgi:hypothetical protein
MRLTVVCASLLLAFVPQAAAKAPPPGPIDVYLDFAGHGHLTKHYPNALLRAIVNDASLNQYGDPLLMMRLRRAARLQLAGAPVVSASQPTPNEGTASTPRQGVPSTTKVGSDSRSGNKAKPRSQTAPRAASGRRPETNTAAAEPLIEAKTLAIVAAIIVLAVGVLRVASARSRKRT